jgi:hypothetical protein
LRELLSASSNQIDERHRLMFRLRELRKYQFMEQNLQRRVAGLKDKMPDISKTLDTVRFLKLRTVGEGQSHPGETYADRVECVSLIQSRSRPPSS